MINIRLGNHHNRDEEASKELIQCIQKYPGSCDVVWFATEYGYPDLAVHAKSAQKMRKIAKLYRDAGVRVSLQISNTIGHGEYMKSRDNSAVDAYGFEKIQGPDGIVSDYSFCWRGKHFTDYCIKSIEVYMPLRPDTVWIDDDLRVLNHAPVQHGCFCEECLKEFNRQYGFDYTREELVWEINYGDVSVRKKYVDFTRQGMYDFTYRLAKAIQKASPHTQLALQYAREGLYTGMDYNYIFRAMYDASSKNVKSRPGGGVYDDKTPMRLLDKMYWIGYSNSALPDYVTDNYPEIENTPDVAFGKSIYGTIKESTLDLAYGCNGLTYAVFMTPYEKMDFHQKMLRAFCEYKSYWQKLIAHNCDTKNGGALIYEPPKAYLRRLKDGDEEFAWENAFEGGSYVRTPQPLMKVGLPLTFDKAGASVFMVSAKTVDSMQNEDIEALLCRPVLIDGPGFKKILDRGFSYAFDVNVYEAKSDFGFTEIFSEHAVNKGFAGMCWTESFFTGTQMQPYALEGAGMESLGDLKVGKTGEHIGTSCAIVYVRDAGGRALSRWAVFGYCVWKDILSSAKRNQIINAADFICGHTMPAVLKSAEQVIVLPRVNRDTKTVSVTLCNASIGKTDVMKLCVRNPVGSDFCLENAHTSVKPKVIRNQNDYLVTIPAMEAWEIITLFIK